MEKHGLWASKAFGQNFLIDKDILDEIVETGNIKPSDHIIEIGPGLGVLTHELCKKAKKVTSIELDKKLPAILAETLSKHKNLNILNEDALDFIPPTTSYKIIANIPYNITSPLLNHFLQTENKPKTITLLVQKEVAEKICQLNPKMTVLSLQVAIFGKAKLIKIVSPSSFYPSPKIDSAILHIETYKKSDPNFFEIKKAKKILKLAKLAFSQRRKKLKNTIGNILKEAKIDLDRRPETLSIKEWKELITNS